MLLSHTNDSITPDGTTTQVAGQGHCLLRGNAPGPGVDLRNVSAPASPGVDLRNVSAPAGPGVDLRNVSATAGPGVDLRNVLAPAHGWI